MVWTTIFFYDVCSNVGNSPPSSPSSPLPYAQPFNFGLACKPSAEIHPLEDKKGMEGSRKNERLSRSWSYSVVMNSEPMDWESTALTTRPTYTIAPEGQKNPQLSTKFIKVLWTSPPTLQTSKINDLWS